MMYVFEIMCLYCSLVDRRKWSREGEAGKSSIYPEQDPEFFGLFVLLVESTRLYPLTALCGLKWYAGKTDPRMDKSGLGRSTLHPCLCGCVLSGSASGQPPGVRFQTGWR